MGGGVAAGLGRVRRGAFRHLDAEEMLPHVPTYYALPSDRDDFKSGTHLWDLSDR